MYQMSSQIWTPVTNFQTVFVLGYLRSRINENKMQLWYHSVLENLTVLNDPEFRKLLLLEETMMGGNSIKKTPLILKTSMCYINYLFRALLMTSAWSMQLAISSIETNFEVNSLLLNEFWTTQNCKIFIAMEIRQIGAGINVQWNICTLVEP